MPISSTSTRHDQPRTRIGQARDLCGRAGRLTRPLVRRTAHAAVVGVALAGASAVSGLPGAAQAQSQGPVDLKLWGPTPADAGGRNRGVLTVPQPAPQPAPATTPPRPQPAPPPAREAPRREAPAAPPAPRVTVPPTEVISVPPLAPVSVPVPTTMPEGGGYALIPIDGATRRGMVLDGEYDIGRFRVLLPDSVAVDRAILQLVYTNSIEDAAEASALDVWVNGQPAARLPLEAHRGPVTARIDLPVDMLTVGPNRIDVVARQRHRLLCTVQSTYELWARIDTTRSRLLLDFGGTLPRPTLASVDSLLTDPRMADESVAVVVSDGFNARGALTAASLAVQAIALRSGPAMPDIDLIDATAEPRLASALTSPASDVMPQAATAAAGTEPSGDRPVPLPRRVVVVGAAPTASLLTGEDQGDIAGGVLRMISWAGSDRTVLLLTGRDIDDAALAARRLGDASRPLPGIDRLVADLYDIETRAPMTWIPQIAGDGALPLSRLDYRSRSFDGMRQRIDLPVDLPVDLYVGDNARVRVSVDAAYGPGVGDRAELAALVNGRFAAALRFENPGGALIEDGELLIPMSLFKPGRNVISFETRLPAPPAFCGPDGIMAGPGGGTPAGGGTPRFTLFDTTTLDFPRFARLANLPDLAVTAGTGFPYDRPGRQLAPFDVVVAMDRPAEVTAAMLVVARMARAAGQPLQASFHDSMPRLQGRDTLIVAPTARLGLDLIAAAPVGPDQIGRLNRGRLPEAAPDEEPGTAGEGAGAAAAGPQLLAAPPRRDAADTGPDRWSNDLREQWRRRLGAESTAGQDEGGPLTWASGSWGWLRTQTRWVLDEALPDSRPAAALFTEDKRPLLAVVQYASPQGVGTTWTLVTAADDRRLLGGTRLLVRDDAWNALNGSVATLASDGHTVDAADGGRSYTVLTSDVGPLGALSITASWFSRNVLIWTGVIAVLIIIAGTTSYLLVRTSPRRPV